MGILNHLTFDNIDSVNYGIFLTKAAVFNTPERRVEKVAIPGRNGDLLIDDGSYENIEVEYSAVLCCDSAEEFASTLGEFRSALASRGAYKKLTGSYNPDEYRLATLIEKFEVDPRAYYMAGEFKILFDCKPQRFLVSGDEPQTFYGNGWITNPTPFEALPIIAVTGNGRINIAGHVVTVSDTTETIYIDSELMEVYIPNGVTENLTDENLEVIRDELLFPITLHKGPRAPISMNNHVSFADYKFPTIGPGEQPIAFDSGIDSVVIYPRWWRL